MMTDLLADLADMADATRWMSRGRCAETDPDAFFPDPRNPDWAPALRVCSGCPVRRQCLVYALDNEIPFGMWGGVDMASLSSGEEGEGVKGAA